ncbi:EamA domain-containing protein [Desulfonema limicola]|uniref:EamA domain-containing protein n=1 Tax=Desulfonema limicola TaxID=45656 RepID=A0A975BBP3_9BACT|nr:EamA family transporter [Desulfonema limicola]QTA82418.1 EamA domain-containing protein [Desulfonema limicola]
MVISRSDSTYKSGYLYVILAAVLWAVSGSAAKFLFNNGVTSFQLAQLRITVAACVLFLWFIINQRSLFKIEQKDIFYFIILGFGAMALVQFTYLLAISKINVAAAILLQYLAPSFIAVYTIVFNREKPELVTLTAVILATGGCYLVVGAYQVNVFSMNKAGILSGILSAAAFAWYSLQGEYGMKKYSPWTVLFYAMFFGALAWNIFYPPLNAFIQPYSFYEWLWILYIGTMGTALPFGLYLKGVSLIRSTRASITATLEPITAGLISYLFLNETMELLQMSGGVLVIFSIILLQLKKKDHNILPDVNQSSKVEDVLNHAK